MRVVTSGRRLKMAISVLIHLGFLSGLALAATVGLALV
jgi:hypothetical protein